MDNTISVSGISLIITNQDQILNMGGPWIGDISTGTELISKDCLIDNLVAKEDLKLLFFVKFNKTSKYTWYFSINFYNIDTKVVCQFDKIFDMLYLGRFVSNTELEIYNAFHGEFENTKEIFNLDNENFTIIEN
ncbi:MAG: hypothetical protein JWQ79_486 [Mucilaginibacter sp.]|jgi:hypothetical protein|nr:hypothetical protein [Mucilaginibacter sp.]